jgi:hypothetical protein
LNRFENLANTYKDLKQKTSLTADEQERFKNVIASLKSEYPQHLRDLDLEKGKYEDVPPRSTRRQRP